MRTFEERREEIFRRSEIQISRRNARRKALGVAAPVVLGTVLFSFLLGPGLLSENSGGNGLTDPDSVSTLIETGVIETGSAESMSGEIGEPAVSAGIIPLSKDDEVSKIVCRTIGDPANLLTVSEIEVPEVSAEPSSDPGEESGAVDNSSAVVHVISQVQFQLSLEDEERTFLFDGTALFDQTSGTVYRVPETDRERLCSLLNIPG